ncbi:MAG: hypothetical protein H0V18_01250 [Pyrinomonadaceae bacterium]|nr:hypothetical protein [Pyrinomonadaceae bacterium]
MKRSGTPGYSPMELSRARRAAVEEIAREEDNSSTLAHFAGINLYVPLT